MQVTCSKLFATQAQSSGMTSSLRKASAMKKSRVLSMLWVISNRQKFNLIIIWLLLLQLRNWMNGTFPDLNVTLSIPPLEDFTTDYVSTITKLLESLNLTSEVDMTSLQVQKLIQDMTTILTESDQKPLNETLGLGPFVLLILKACCFRITEVVSKMKEFDEIMQGNELWQVLEQYAHAASLVMEYANNQIEKFRGWFTSNIHECLAT